MTEVYITVKGDGKRQLIVDGSLDLLGQFLDVMRTVNGQPIKPRDVTPPVPQPATPAQPQPCEARHAW